MRVHSQSPAGHVKLVNAIVSQISGAKVVPPVPRIVVPVSLERHQRRRSHPHVVVKLRRWTTRLRAANVAAPLNVPSFGNQHVTDNTIPKHLHGLHESLVAARLSSVLDDPTRSSHSFNQQPSLAKIV